MTPVVPYQMLPNHLLDGGKAEQLESGVTGVPYNPVGLLFTLLGVEVLHRCSLVLAAFLHHL